MKSSDLKYFCDDKRILEHVIIELDWLHLIYFLLKLFPLGCWTGDEWVQHSSLEESICLHADFEKY